MALNLSGPISIGDSIVGQSIELELGLSGTVSASLNDTDFRTLAGVPTGTISLSDFYGKSVGVQASNPLFSIMLMPASYTVFGSTINVDYSILYNNEINGSGTGVVLTSLLSYKGFIIAPIDETNTFGAGMAVRVSGASDLMSPYIRELSTIAPVSPSAPGIYNAVFNDSYLYSYIINLTTSNVNWTVTLDDTYIRAAVSYYDNSTYCVTVKKGSPHLIKLTATGAIALNKAITYDGVSITNAIIQESVVATAISSNTVYMAYSAPQQLDGAGWIQLGGSSGYNIIVHKIINVGSSGTFSWTKVFSLHQPENMIIDMLCDIQVSDADDRVYVSLVAYVAATQIYYSIIVALNTAGDFIWSKAIYHGSNNAQHGYITMSLDNIDNMLYAFVKPINSPQKYLYQLDAVDGTITASIQMTDNKPYSNRYRSYIQKSNMNISGAAYSPLSLSNLGSSSYIFRIDPDRLFVDDITGTIANHPNIPCYFQTYTGPAASSLIPTFYTHSYNIGFGTTSQVTADTLVPTTQTTAVTAQVTELMHQ